MSVVAIEEKEIAIEIEKGIEIEIDETPIDGTGKISALNSKFQPILCIFSFQFLGAVQNEKIKNAFGRDLQFPTAFKYVVYKSQSPIKNGRLWRFAFMDGP